MKYIKQMIMLCAVLLFMAPQTYAQSTMKVVFLCSDNRQHDFFGPFISFMEAAAAGLNINLEVIEVQHNNFRDMFRKGKAVLAREKLPDYLLMVDEKNTAAELINLARDKNIKTFLVNERLKPEKYVELGQPGEKIKNWLGELMADEVQAGYLLANELIDQASLQNLRGKDGKIHIAAINGSYKSNASKKRLEGLQKAVDARSDVILHQVVYALWERGNALHQTQGLLKRYPELGAIWVASDAMADGAIEAAMQMGKKPGVEILFGGVDWADVGIKNIEKGHALGSIGGHVFDGGWALVMLYDHFNGIALETSNRSKFSVLKRENIHLYGKHLSLLKGVDQLDFMKFTKISSGKNQPYDFSLDKILDLLESKQSR